MGKNSRLKKERRNAVANPYMAQQKLYSANGLFHDLTTPNELSNSVLSFCHSLSDQAPFYITCKPELWSRLGCCDSNVEEYIRQNGCGKSAFGFRIWTNGPNYMEAESHAIWRDGNACRDVSFSNDGEDRILFLPISNSFVGEFDDVPKKVRKAYGKENIELLKVYEDYEAHYVIPNRQQMSRAEAWDHMLTYEQWLKGERSTPMVKQAVRGS